MKNLVFCDCVNHVAHIRINSQETGDRFNVQLFRELKEICTRIKQDEGVYVAVLTGTGKTFFPKNVAVAKHFQENFANEISGIDKPVIAAINGDALGKGLELVLACDIRIASNTAHFGMPQITGGFIPSNGGTQRLPRLIGRAKALELILTGDIIDASEALEIGLIHKTFPADILGVEVEKIAKTMANKAPFALNYAKEAVMKGMDLTLEQGLRLEADLYMLLHTTGDRVEGITAFQQKSTPDFKGK